MLKTLLRLLYPKSMRRLFRIQRKDSVIESVLNSSDEDHKMSDHSLMRMALEK